MRITRATIVQTVGIADDFLDELVRERIVVCDHDGTFEVQFVERIRICWNLHNDLGVNLEGLEVALALLGRIDEERRQFREVLGWLGGELGG